MAVILKLLSIFFVTTFTTEYEVYNIYKSTCCDGIVHPRLDDDSKDYICCGKTLYTVDRSIQYKCCGDSPIDSKKFYCFNNSIPKALPESEDFFLCGTSVNELKEYNVKSQICCDGIIHDNADRTKACCGNTVINKTTHKCCEIYHNYKSLNKFEAAPYGNVPPSKAECCIFENQTIVIYDETKQRCIDIQLIDKDTQVERRYCGKDFNYKSGIWSLSETQKDNAEDSTSSAYPIFLKLANHSYFICFKNELNNFDIATETCGENENTQLYNSNTQTCCNEDEVVDLKAEETADKKFFCC